MGLFKALDAIVHGGVQQPESYEKKKNYTFMEVLGINHTGAYFHSKVLMSFDMVNYRKWFFWFS